MQFGSKAQSAIEVGCANDPFLRHLGIFADDFVFGFVVTHLAHLSFPRLVPRKGWIGDRTCVAPYFVKYNGEASKDKNVVKKIVADFMEYKPEKTFDLLLCNQVIEHVENPAAFMKKMIESATISIISAPYNWPDCGKQCGHVTNNITPAMFAEWSSPYTPVVSEVVIEEETEEKDSFKFVKRIIWVFDRSNDSSKR